MAGVARNFWAMMALLTTVALTSFTVHAILETDTTEVSFESQQITGNLVKEEHNVSEEGLSGVISEAADWVING